MSLPAWDQLVGEGYRTVGPLVFGVVVWWGVNNDGRGGVTYCFCYEMHTEDKSKRLKKQITQPTLQQVLPSTINFLNVQTPKKFVVITLKFKP